MKKIQKHLARTPPEWSIANVFKMHEHGWYKRRKKWSSDVSVWARLNEVRVGANFNISTTHIGMDVELVFVGVRLEMWKRKNEDKAWNTET